MSVNKKLTPSELNAMLTDLFPSGMKKEDYDSLLDLVTFGKTRKSMTVEDWLSAHNISDYDLLSFPNARTAAELKASPLAKALE